jgi:hypothetical protein
MKRADDPLAAARGHDPLRPRAFADERDEERGVRVLVAARLRRRVGAFFAVGVK